MAALVLFTLVIAVTASFLIVRSPSLLHRSLGAALLSLAAAWWAFPLLGYTGCNGRDCGPGYALLSAVYAGLQVVLVLLVVGALARALRRLVAARRSGTSP